MTDRGPRLHEIASSRDGSGAPSALRDADRLAAIPLADAAARAAPYRIVFALAAAYNVALGAWTVALPNQFFDVMGLARPVYPGVWQCLGMVLGLYGLLYAHAAWRPERARPIIAVGLLGKVLGPIGWLVATGRGEWPVRTVSLLFLNDLVWWIPFSLFLLEGTRVRAWIGARPRVPALVCAATNAAGLAWFGLFIRPGTELEPDVAARAAYIGSHPTLWRCGWLLWLVAASALVAFLGTFGARSPRPRLALLGFLVAAVGVLFDATGDSIFVGWLPERMDLARTAALLSGATANGLYSLGGAVATAADSSMAPRLRRLGFLAWAAGGALTVAVLVDHVPSIVATTGLTFALFLPWVILVARSLPARSATC